MSNAPHVTSITYHIEGNAQHLCFVRTRGIRLDMQCKRCVFVCTRSSAHQLSPSPPTLSLQRNSRSTSGVGLMAVAARFNLKQPSARPSKDKPQSRHGRRPERESSVSQRDSCSIRQSLNLKEPSARPSKDKPQSRHGRRLVPWRETLKFKSRRRAH